MASFVASHKYFLKTAFMFSLPLSPAPLQATKTTSFLSSSYFSSLKIKYNP